MKKNILLIVTDQHRLDTLSCYNSATLCKTPNLDEIAKHSVVFNNAYTTCPVCSPARSSLLSGFYPSKTGMDTNIYDTGCRTHELLDGDYILSRRLAPLGYNLGYTGKWHLGLGADKMADKKGRWLIEAAKSGNMQIGAYENYGTLPTDLGFEGDNFPGHGDGGWKFSQFHKYLKDNNLELKIENIGGGERYGDHSIWGDVTSGPETTVEHFLTQRTMEIIDGFEDQEKPFFLALNYWGPHAPFYAPTEYIDMYRNVSIPENPSFSEDATTMPRIYNLIRRPELPWSFFENTLRHYYANITFIDYQIGKLVDYLKEKGIYDNTMIIFTADHGDNQGCHGGLENKSYSMYDDTTNIPLIMKPAQADFVGYTQTAFANTCDIYATVLDAAGYKPQDELGFCDGRPLNRFIDSDSKEDWSNEVVTQGMGAFEVITTQRMYRQDNWKYVFNGAGEDQLFDLESDPNEMHNLIDSKKHQEKLVQLKKGLSAWMVKNGDNIRAAFCKLNNIDDWA